MRSLTGGSARMSTRENHAAVGVVPKDERLVAPRAWKPAWGSRVNAEQENVARDAGERPLVSCIIIFLNGEAHIREAIESVFAQNYAHWELILVDDGTTDGATAIAKEFAEQYPERVTYTEHPNHENRGMSASRNAGLGIARGDYVAFLDADDIWLPDRLRIHVDLMERHPDVVMSMAPTLLWSSWNRDNLPKSKPWLAADMETELGLPEGVPIPAPLAARYYLASHGAGVPGICSLLIRRTRLLEVGGFEDAFRGLYEDQVMIFKILLNFPVIAIHDIQDFYRQHDASACGQAGRTTGDRKMRPVFLEWLQGYMVDRGIKDPDVWKALRGEMWKFDNPRIYRMVNIPNGIVDTWNIESRRAVIWLLTPGLYQRLRRLFGLKEVDLGSVGVNAPYRAEGAGKVADR
jgi:glycosyltransferase involved in cell wall biosynthesis